MDAVRVGVVGIGNIGSVHSACIANGEVNGMVLAAVCDIDSDRTAPFAAGGIAVYDDYAEMFGSGKIDAAIIAVPHRLHSRFAQEALAAGLHVLVEKPLDIAVSKTQKLFETAKNSGKVFSIMFNQRTDPLFQKARNIVRSGQLGELKRTTWIVTNWYRTQHYYDSGAWRATWAGEGGGVLLNQAPHNLDLWQWICGMPEAVTAFCPVGKYHNIEVEDEATIFTRYCNGATGMFLTSTGEYPGTNRLEISGDLGKLLLENGTMKWWKLESSVSKTTKTAQESFTAIPFGYEEIIPEDKASGHKVVLQNFANAVLHGEPLLCPGEDGICELTLSNAAYLSHWLGNKEITLPLDTQAFDRLLAEKTTASTFRETAASFRPDGNYNSRWQVNW